MKKIGIEDIKQESKKQAVSEIINEAQMEGEDVNIFFFNPEDQVILNKSTIYILVIVGIIVGYIAAYITL